MNEPGPFDARAKIRAHAEGLHQAIAAIAFAVLALGLIAMAAAPGMSRVERDYQSARV